MQAKAGGSGAGGLGQGVWGRGSGAGGSGAGGSRAGGLGLGGQGTFYPPCHILHHHMVLRPEGTSHNKSKAYSVLPNDSCRPLTRTRPSCDLDIRGRSGNPRDPPPGCDCCTAQQKI